jgi:hypothetical protein
LLRADKLQEAIHMAKKAKLKMIGGHKGGKKKGHKGGRRKR